MYAQLLFNSWSGMDKNCSSTLQHTSTQNHDVGRPDSTESMHKSLHLLISFAGVITPHYYGLQYEDIELLTSDKIILRCYLLQPAKTSSRTEASKTSEPIELEAAAVCRRIQSCFNYDVAR